MAAPVWGHAQIRRRGHRWRRRRPVRSPGPVACTPHGSRRGRRRAAQRAGHPHARLPLPRRCPTRRSADRSRREVEGYGGDIVAGTVTDLLRDGPSRFWVLLADGQRISARRLLVTTGLPDIPGLRDRWARDVLHCPYCHGHEVRDRPLGVIGGTPGAVRYAQIVRQWTHDLVYFTPPDMLTATDRIQLLARAIGVVEGTIEQLVTDGEDRLRGVQMHDGCVIPRGALFVPPHFVPNGSLLIGLGCDADDGWVTADATGRTSVPGVWAAGNVVDPRAQVITAAGAGSAAANALNVDLVDDDVRTAIRDLDHGFPPSPTASTRSHTGTKDPA
jgi:thioredoxin reductase